MRLKVTNVSSDTNLNTTPETRNHRIHMQEVAENAETPLFSAAPSISNLTLVCTAEDAARYAIGTTVSVTITPDAR